MQPRRRRGKDSPTSRREVDFKCPVVLASTEIKPDLYFGEVVKEKGPDPADSSASEFVTSSGPRCRAVYVCNILSVYVYEMSTMNSSWKRVAQARHPTITALGQLPAALR